MWYLFVISAVLFIFSLNMTTSINKCKTKKVGVISLDNAKYVFVFLLLLFLTMFRGENIGNDTKSYMYYFQVIGNNGVTSAINFEYGYQYFNLIISNISKDPRAIIIATSLLSYFIFGIYYFRKCKSPFLAIVMFYTLFFSMFTNVIRMVCSISLILWAYDSIENKKIIRTVFFMTMAILFHTTSIVFIPFLFISYFDIKLSKKIFTVFSLVFAFFCLASDYILIIVTKIVGSYGGRFSNSSYMTSSRTETGFFGILLSLIVLGAIYFCYSKLVEKNKQKESTKWLFAFSCLFFILSFVMNLFDRLADVFLFVLIVPVVNEIMESNKKNKKILLISLISFLLIIFLMKIVLRPEWNNLYPYLFMWN